MISLLQLHTFDRLKKNMTCIQTQTSKSTSPTLPYQRIATAAVTWSRARWFHYHTSQTSIKTRGSWRRRPSSRHTWRPWRSVQVRSTYIWCALHLTLSYSHGSFWYLSQLRCQLFSKRPTYSKQGWRQCQWQAYCAEENPRMRCSKRHPNGRQC